MKIDVDLQENIKMEILSFPDVVCVVLKNPDDQTDINVHMTKEKFEYLLEEMEHYKKYR